MAEVIDFKTAIKNAAKTQAESPVAGDETELEYDPKPDSVAVKLLTDVTGCAHFTVTAPAADLDVVLAQAQAGLAATFGAPADEQTYQALREQMGEGAYQGFLTTFVQRHFFSKALLRTGVLSFLDPDHLTSDAPVPGEDYTFKIDCLLRPNYELSDYGPVRVTMPEKPAVSSKDVSAYLDNMSQELATWENDPAATAVQEGSHVSLNLESTVDGRPFAQLSGRHIPYVVGSMQLGPEFDLQLVGMAPRERKEFSLSLPLSQNEQGELVYQVVQVKAQIDEIHRSVPAKIDDAWVLQNMPEAQTLLGLRNKIRTMLERQADQAYHSELLVLTAEELSKRLMGNPDERYVEKMRDELLSDTMQRLEMQGLVLEDLFAQEGFDREAWEAELEEKAVASLRRGLALDSLADHLDIKLEEKDIALVVTQMAPGHEQEMLQSLIDSGQMPRMCETALRMRANEWLVEHLPKAPIAGGSVILGGGSDRPRTSGEGPKLTLL